MFVDELWILQPNELQRYAAGTEGLVIQQLAKDGPAMQAGLKKGEVIVAIDGKKFRYRDHLLRKIRIHEPGQEVTITVVAPQGAGQRDVTVSVGRLEVQWPQAQP